MKSTFSILFYLKRNGKKQNGNAPIMGRITVNGKAVQFSAKVEVKPDLWSVKAGKATGKSTQAQEVNAILESMKASMTKVYRELQEQGMYILPEKIKNIFFGTDTDERTLVKLFAKHNADYKQLIGTSVTNITYNKYERVLFVLQEFMQSKYAVSDRALKDITDEFVTDFIIYLRTTMNLCNNTVHKYIQRFKRVMTIALKKGWLRVDPFGNYKASLDKTDRGYLTSQELETLMQKSFESEALGRIRDVFVFSCFTGLAYAEVKNLKTHHVRPSFDGNLWITTKRHKTDARLHIPLLDIPKMILDKYKGLPDGKLLPVKSNSGMNTALRQIAGLCGIDKRLSYHVARHTFSTTVTLANGVPIESVSKMLGHASIKTTQIYARVIDSKVSRDMGALAVRLKGTMENVYMNTNPKSETDLCFENLSLQEKMTLFNFPAMPSNENDREVRLWTIWSVFCEEEKQSLLAAFNGAKNAMHSFVNAKAGKKQAIINQ